MTQTAAAPDDVIDLAVAALAQPVDVRPPLGDRLAAWARELTSTPRRAAMATAWCFALLVAAAALAPSSASVQTATGPARADCGLDTFLYGYPDTAVRGACRHAEAGRLALFLPAALVVLAGIVAAAATAGRRRPTPVRLGLWALLACAAIASVLSLRPATAELPGRGTLATAHCGADTFFLGYPDHAVETACRHAYAPHARVLFGAVFLGAFAVVALAATGGHRPGRRRAAPLALAGAAAVVAACLLWPVTVSFGSGASAATARCGVDTVIAGFPDHAVERACRDRVGHRAAGAVGAILIALTGAGLYVAAQREHREVAP